MTHFLVKRAQGRIQLGNGEELGSDDALQLPSDAPPQSQFLPKPEPQKSKSSSPKRGDAKNDLGRRVFERCKENARRSKGVHLSPTDLALLLEYLKLPR